MTLEFEGLDMRKSLVCLAIVGASMSSAAFGQQSPPPSAPSDATAAVRSESLGMPGSITNPTDAYIQQKTLNNLSDKQAGASTNRKLGVARPAKPNELTEGAVVNDKTGLEIATIAQVDPDGVIVSTPTGKVKIPTDAFGHNKGGLLLDTTKAEFQQTVAKANAGS